jgi:hypothetical protein
VLWVDGTNDVNYPFEVLRMSYLLPKGERTLVTRVRMKHSHSAGWAPEEIYAYADERLKGGKPLAKAGDSGWVSIKETGDAVATKPSDLMKFNAFKSVSPIVKAELNYTTDSGDWKKRKWETIAARIGASGRTATASVPEGTTAWFFNLTDERGLIVSSELQIVQ